MDSGSKVACMIPLIGYQDLFRISDPNGSIFHVQEYALFGTLVILVVDSNFFLGNPAKGAGPKSEPVDKLVWTLCSQVRTAVTYQ